MVFSGLVVFRSGVQWEAFELFRALAIGILVQAASNVSNSYWDFVNGKDGPMVGQKPTEPVMAHKNVLTSGSVVLTFCQYALPVPPQNFQSRLMSSTGHTVGRRHLTTVPTLPLHLALRREHGPHTPQALVQQRASHHLLLGAKQAFPSRSFSGVPTHRDK
jgi:hypothetical protein